MIKFLNTFGLFTNIAIILFADSTVVQAYPLEVRWTMMFYIENILLISVFFFKLSFLPNWFEYAEKAKISYLISTMNAAELAEFRQEKTKIMKDEELKKIE